MANNLKRRVRVLDHGMFTLFGMRVPIPGFVELSEDQISYVKNSGLYMIDETGADLFTQARPTALSSIEGDRFQHARTRSVNELSFKTPLMGSTFAEKAKNALVIKRNSQIVKDAENGRFERTTNKKNVKPTKKVEATPEAPKSKVVTMIPVPKEEKPTDKEVKK